MDDSWKEAYDERLSGWKAENAARREQSERTRGEWEKRSGDSTYSFTNATAGSSMASSFVDARDLVGGEGEGGKGVEALDVRYFTHNTSHKFTNWITAGPLFVCSQTASKPPQLWRG